MGGTIVIDYTLTHPDRVAALVTAAAGMTGFPWQPTPGQAQLEAELGATSKAVDHERVDERLRRLIADNTAAIATNGHKISTRSAGLREAAQHPGARPRSGRRS